MVWRQAQAHTLTFIAPFSTKVGSLYSRFRVTAELGEAPQPYGLAESGEVENAVLMSLGTRVWLGNGASGRVADTACTTVAKQASLAW